MHNKQSGFIEILALLMLVALFGALFFIQFQPSVERVSGVAYNTSNDNFISGSTHFSIRASEDTYVSQENKSSYCLPKGSPYIDLVNRAAEDKSIKLIVTADKYLALMWPWECYPNVKVTEVKK